MWLFKGKLDGFFENLMVNEFKRDVWYEDVSVVIIDFDGDGDKDLYIVSGGSVVWELDKVLEDWFYLNNGGMEFWCILIFLFYINVSVVKVVDFNGDGFEDIFVGVRLIFGFYGLFFYSFLLIN